MPNWIRGALMTGLAGLLFFATGLPTTAAEEEQKPLVLVAGATGRTGQEVVKQLLARNYRVRALVRDVPRGEQMFGSSVQYAVGDVRQSATLAPAMRGTAYIVCAIGSSRDDPTNSPEQVDYLGVKNLADAAQAAAVSQFVLVSAMGVTQGDPSSEERPAHPSRPGIRQWKLKGENHLRASGLAYTIVRPGGLSDKPGGQQGIRVTQGDKPMEGKTPPPMIPRADVAAVLVNALGNPDAYDKTFEIRGDAAAQPVNWANFFKPLVKDKN